MLTQRKLLDRCLAHYRMDSYGSIRDDVSMLLGLFADMRGAPERLAELLEGVPGADDIVHRFRFLVDASGDGIVDPEKGIVRPYAVVTDPADVDPATVESLVRAHYEKMAALLREAGKEEAAAELEAERAFERRDAAPELAYDYRDELGDFIRDHLDYDSLVSVLREAAYGFAASYELAWFMLWSHYGETIATEDPFRPYAALWKAGVRFGRTADRLVVWTP